MPDRLTPPLPGRATALLAGIGALGAALVLLRVSEWGAGVGSDGAYFVSAAQNLQDGHGFVNYRGGAYTGLGPLLPLALAFLGLFGPDPVDAAGWLHAAAFGLTVFVAAVWVRARTRSVFLAGWAGLACALSLPLAHWASLVMTEPLFILFATLSLFALDRWLGGDRAMPGITGGRQLLFAAATAAALACATRYLGLALVACALPLVLTADRRGVPLGARAARAAIFAAVALAPIGAWMLRNLLLTGSSPTGTLHATGWDSLAAARTATGELARWVLGEGGYALLPSEGGASLAGALLAGVLIASAAFAWRRSDLRGGLLVPAAFAAAWIPAVLLSNWRYDFELLARYFAPLYPPLLAAAAIALGGLLREASLRGPRVRLPLPRRAGGTAASLPALALAAALALWLPQQALANYGDIRERRTDGWGYSGRHYAESETVRYLADRSLDGPFWSVTPQVTYLWTNERLRNYTLPGVLPADAHRWIAEARAEGREAWVVWPHIDSARRREYGVADLAALPGLEVAAVLEDGVVFRGSEDASGGSIAEALLRDARLLGSSRFDLWLDGDGKRLISSCARSAPRTTRARSSSTCTPRPAPIRPRPGGPDTKPSRHGSRGTDSGRTGAASSSAASRSTASPPSGPASAARTAANAGRCASPGRERERGRRRGSTPARCGAPSRLPANRSRCTSTAAV